MHNEKVTFFSRLFSLVLLLIGCQENSITDPASTEQVNKDQNPGPYQHGFISLERMLSDPYPVMNSFYIINGQIEYEHRVVSQNYVSLHLVDQCRASKFMHSMFSIRKRYTLVAFISNDSEDYLLITGSFTVLEKSFTIQGREDGMVLKCRFLVTTGGIELSAMWLVLPDKDVVAANQ